MTPDTRTEHRCYDRDDQEIVDDMGRPVAPDVKTCWRCLGQWCDRCDPTPAALCVFCHGRGSSEHELAYSARTGRYYNGRGDTRLSEDEIR